ncbi:MAG: glycosyltransferase family 39 protein [Candidatus Omnitrophica bacterium]|nr:glycosyltransferase family 39 protein [Candidatus Omnitrophota bacterium]
MKLERKILLIIIIILCFHILINFYILYNSKIIREGDDANYISDSFRFNLALSNEGYKGVMQQFLNIGGMGHPKFFSLIASFICESLKKIRLESINSLILFTNAFFLFILLISVYGIGSILYGKKIGLLAAILLSFSPVIFSFSRMFILDFPLAAMISLSFLALLKTKNFSSLFFSVLTGILFSIAQFTKETAIIFILPPFLYYSFSSLYIKEKTKERRINFSITLFLFLIFVSVVYFNAYNKELVKILHGKLLVCTNSDFFYYVRRFPLCYLYLGNIFSIVILPLVLSYIVNIKKRNIFLALYLFSPFLIFSFVPNKTPRLLMPALPPLFLLLASEVFSLRHRKIRKMYIGILIFSVVFQYVRFNFSPKIPTKYDMHGTGLLNIVEDKDFYIIEKLLNFFKNEKLPFDRSYLVVFTFRRINCVLNCEFLLRNMLFVAECPLDSDVVNAPPPGEVNWKEYLLTADYVVDKTGDIKKRGVLEDITGEFKKSLEENAHFFKKVYSCRDSNGDFIFVYKNVKKII